MALTEERPVLIETEFGLPIADAKEPSSFDALMERVPNLSQVDAWNRLKETYGGQVQSRHWSLANQREAATQAGLDIIRFGYSTEEIDPITCAAVGVTLCRGFVNLGLTMSVVNGFLSHLDSLRDKVRGKPFMATYSDKATVLGKAEAIADPLLSGYPETKMDYYGNFRLYSQPIFLVGRSDGRLVHLPLFDEEMHPIFPRLSMEEDARNMPDEPEIYFGSDEILLAKTPSGH